MIDVSWFISHKFDGVDHLLLSQSEPSTRDGSSHILRGREGQSNSWVSTREMGFGSPYYSRKVGRITLEYYVWGMGMYGLCFRIGPYKNWITPDPLLDPTWNLTCGLLLFNLTLVGFVFLLTSLSLFLHAFCVSLWPRCTSSLTTCSSDLSLVIVTLRNLCTVVILKKENLKSFA